MQLTISNFFKTIFYFSINLILFISKKMPHLFKSHPRTYGFDSRACRLCNNTHAMVNKYGISMCRKCFREQAPLIGFIKYR